MSLFRNPEEHAANPPETWKVVKRAERLWSLTTADGGVLESFRTKREATIAREYSPSARLYDAERRWYAGEHITPWKPYAQVKAEREATEARWAVR